ncbi:MAG: hypothetical protein U0T11_01010 [Chitinophagaceae bacterium]
MERIASLIEQLHQGYHNKADAAQLLVLTNLIQPNSRNRWLLQELRLDRNGWQLCFRALPQFPK